MPEACSLDHVGIVGRDIDGMLAAWRRLGFAPTVPRPLMARDPATGRPVSLQQTSAHLVFESGYVELSAVHTDSPAHHLAAYLGRGTGLHILAFGTDDAAAAHARCAAAGQQPLPLARASREIAYGERRGEARFEWFMLAPVVAPEGLICFVRQETPELVFQPAVQRHPNGVTALVGVYLLSDDPPRCARRVAALTGAAAGQVDVATVALSGGWLRCLDGAGFDRRFPGAARPEQPALAGLALKVRDLETARRLVCAGGLQPRDRPGGFWVGPEHASGAVVEFCG